MSFPAVKAQNKSSINLMYTVVDSVMNCTKGKRLFGDEGVVFESNFKKGITYANVKILNIAGTLHYCLEYEEVISIACKKRAQFIVVSRHPAQNDGLPTAFTLQNVVSPNGYCGQIGVVLLSVKVLTDLFNAQGYRLIADYFSTDDPYKFWKHNKTSIPIKYSSIIEHSLVFQRAQIT